MSGESEVPKLKLKVVDAGKKKKRGSTESGSSSDVASETVASRMKRTKRAAAAVTPKGSINLDPIEEEVDKPKEAEALAAIPELTIMDLDAIPEVGQGGGETSKALSNTGGQDLLVSLTTSSLKVCDF